MTLPPDIKRCQGVRSQPQCVSCLRRIVLQEEQKHTDNHHKIIHMMPPKAAYENACRDFIGEAHE